MQTVIRSIMSLLAAGALTAPGLTAPVPKPSDGANTLSQPEISGGWLLLFDGETTFGWAVSDPNNKAEATVKNGSLVFSGTSAKLVCTTRFRNFELTGEYRTNTKGVLFAAECKDDGGRVIFRDSLVPKAGGGWRQLTLRVDAGKLAMSAGGEHPGPRWRGQSTEGFTIGFDLPDAKAGSVELRNLKLRPRGLTPLFNGKDLTGWTVFQDAKRSKSKFAVTPAGELHLTNGPGDLQTNNKYDDFVLQLECKTNGKALNSGVFFRCIPNQYQNGYEMQINNGYKNGDRTKPSDGGTGAIYRRVTARKIVANDGEWFAMTLIADGTHFATWVNGYQTADWTDTRKPDDNPRKGRRTAAGHLSIQGHDPTTDILFRNIRIGELKKN